MAEAVDYDRGRIRLSIPPGTDLAIHLQGMTESERRSWATTAMRFFMYLTTSKSASATMADLFREQPAAPSTAKVRRTKKSPTGDIAQKLDDSVSGKTTAETNQLAGPTLIKKQLPLKGVLGATRSAFRGN